MLGAGTDQLVEPEQTKRTNEVIDEVRILDNPVEAVDQSQDVQCHVEDVSYPECIEDVPPRWLAGEHVHYYYDEAEQDAGHTSHVFVEPEVKFGWRIRSEGKEH
jgi:hypothetical protein